MKIEKNVVTYCVLGFHFYKILFHIISMELWRDCSIRRRFAKSGFPSKKTLLVMLNFMLEFLVITNIIAVEKEHKNTSLISEPVAGPLGPCLDKITSEALWKMHKQYCTIHPLVADFYGFGGKRCRFSHRFKTLWSLTRRGPRPAE